MPPPAIDYGAAYPNAQWFVIAEEYKSVDAET
jgi:hypothetical protein